jgi:hypothetical protein
VDCKHLKKIFGNTGTYRQVEVGAHAGHGARRPLDMIPATRPDTCSGQGWSAADQRLDRLNDPGALSHNHDALQSIANAGKMAVQVPW